MDQDEGILVGECWSCRQCTLKNRMGIAKCKACDSPNHLLLDINSPEDNSVQGSSGCWFCSRCTLVNSDERARCMACHKKRFPSSPILSQSRPSVPPASPTLTPPTAPEPCWECPRCTFHNPIIRTKCGTCGASSPQKSSSPAPGWTCPRCGRKNENGQIRCTGCHHGGSPLSPTTGPSPPSTPAITPVTPPAVSAPYWECPRCTFHNPTTRTKCSACRSSASPAPPTTPPARSPPSTPLPPSPIPFGRTEEPFWQCPRCTFHNSLDQTNCSACGASGRNSSAQAPPITPPGSPPFTPSHNSSHTFGSNIWSCPRCTFENRLRNKCCDACFFLRPEDRTASAEDVQTRQRHHQQRFDQTTSFRSEDGWVCGSLQSRELLAQEEAAAKESSQILAQNRASGKTNFVDDAFPPTYRSLYGCSKPDTDPQPDHKWLRPVDVKPSGSSPWVLIHRDISPHDIVQGGLGDCWFLAALSVAASRPHLIDRILLTKKYNPEGIYAVQFVHNGQWTRVIVDDYFPTVHGQFVYGRCKDNQLWVAVIEKAYAKLHGSFRGIKSGRTHEALQELTGVPCETLSFSVDDKAFDPDVTWARLLSFQQQNFLMGASCGRHSVDATQYESIGLIANHGYSMIDIHSEPGLRLVKLRNPWGKSKWKGDWSPDSPLWTPELRQRLATHMHGQAPIGPK